MDPNLHVKVWIYSLSSKAVWFKFLTVLFYEVEIKVTEEKMKSMPWSKLSILAFILSFYYKSYIRFI